MDKSSPFALHTDEYDRWYDDARAVFDAEARAVRYFLPTTKGARIVEIGVGTGRFAKALKVWAGIDVCVEMLEKAAGRGVDVLRGCAHHLPLAPHSCDCVVMVTVLCFLSDPARALAEIRGALRPGGRLVIGFIDRHSPLGRQYEARKEKSRFYGDARFFSAGEVKELLAAAGFSAVDFVQTLVNPLDKVDESEPVLEGTGQGGFVAAGAR